MQAAERLVSVETAYNQTVYSTNKVLRQELAFNPVNSTYSTGIIKLTV